MAALRPRYRALKIRLFLAYHGVNIPKAEWNRVNTPLYRKVQRRLFFEEDSFGWLRCEGFFKKNHLAFTPLRMTRQGGEVG